MKKSTYTTKKGLTRVQVNFAVSSEVAEKFSAICNGLSPSTIFSQMVQKEFVQKILEKNHGDFAAAKAELSSYPILG